MNPLFFILPAAGAIAFAFWGAWQMFLGDAVDQRKLARRLGAAGPAANLPEARSVRADVRLTGLDAQLVKWSPLATLHRAVLHSFPDLSLARFLGIVIGLGFVGFMACWILMDAMIVAVAGGAVAGYIPFLMVAAKGNRRQRRLAGQIPEALDFLSRILRAGHSFSTGLQMLGEELPAPLNAEFRRCYDQHSLGQPLEDGLKEMVARIDSNDFAFFITAVLIQRQTGGDLSEVLTNIGGMIRDRIRLQQHVKAKTAEGRLTGYILVAFPVVMFLIINGLSPQYGKQLTQTALGIKLLITAFVLQSLGLYTIRKITTVRC